MKPDFQIIWLGFRAGSIWRTSTIPEAESIMLAVSNLQHFALAATNQHYACRSRKPRWQREGLSATSERAASEPWMPLRLWISSSSFAAPFTFKALGLISLNPKPVTEPSTLHHEILFRILPKDIPFCLCLRRPRGVERGHQHPRSSNHRLQTPTESAGLLVGRTVFCVRL